LIVSIRAERVILAADLAERCSVETKVRLQPVKRKPERFPEDFMFHKKKHRFNFLSSKVVTLKRGSTSSGCLTLSQSRR
jgi:hypothetical protein